MEIINSIEACGTDSGIPKAKVLISNCGVIEEEIKKHVVQHHH